MLSIQEESHDGHSNIQERPIRRKQQQQALYHEIQYII